MKTLQPLASIGALFALVLALVPPLSAQTATAFKARLSAMPFDLSTAAVMAGRGAVTATLTGNKLVLTGSFEDLPSPATVARLHKAQRGIRGDAVLDLQVTKGTSGAINATLELTPAQVSNLQNGRLYVQVHSEKAPDGHLWGWLLPQEMKR